MYAYGGLRGVAAVWVCVFHLTLESSLRWDIQGNSIMPLFFILSGFTLTAIHGRKPFKMKHRANIILNLGCGQPSLKDLTNGTTILNDSLPLFDTYRFYRNRLARVMPLYYSSMLLALPCTVAGFGFFDPKDLHAWATSALINVFPLSSWFSFVLGLSWNAPAWTVATLMAFWLYFPRWLPHTQRMTNQELCAGICRCYWVQLIVCLVSHFSVKYIGNAHRTAFVTSTMNPFTRYPVFLMGMYAATLSLRHPKGAAGHQPSHPLLPAGACFSIFPRRCSSQQNIISVDYISGILLGLTLLVCALVIRLQIIHGADTPMRDLGQVCFQGVVPFLQLQLIVSLAREGSSWSFRLLSTPYAQFMGRISMALYMVHFPLIYYLCWLLHGKALWWPNELNNCQEYHHEGQRRDCLEWASNRLIPIWGIPVVFVASVALASFVHHWIEVPARNRLRFADPKHKKKQL